MTADAVDGRWTEREMTCDAVEGLFLSRFSPPTVSKVFSEERSATDDRVGGHFPEHPEAFDHVMRG